MKNISNIIKQAWIRKDVGDVARPLLLWILGVPGGIVLLLWFFFFRGK